MKKSNGPKKQLSAADQAALLKILKTRFEKNMSRHKNLSWPNVEEKLVASKEKMWSLNEMEKTGGEPDVINHNKKIYAYPFIIRLLICI